MSRINKHSATDKIRAVQFYPAVVGVRKITTLYSLSAKKRVTLANYDRRGKSKSIDNAIIAAFKRIVHGEFNRCDVYGEDGFLICTVMDYNKMGIGATWATANLSMEG
jgi:hypothetical protein